jgi:carbon storage regulator
MLVLTRRTGQSIRIGPGIDVRVIRIEGDRVVLGIAAPRHVAVVRSELVEQVSGEVREAADARAKLRVMLAPVRAVPVRDPSSDPLAPVEPLYPENPDDPADPEDPGVA